MPTANLSGHPMHLEPVNLLHFIGFSLGIFGLFLIQGKPAFSSFKLLLILEISLMLLNLAEERTHFRNYLLLTPLFTLGFGPAIYLFCRQLSLGQPLTLRDAQHFAPMLLAVLLTPWPQSIILLGSISQIIYLFAAFKLIRRYHKAASEYRSDNDRLNLQWIYIQLGLIIIMMLQDLLRLNLQPFISIEANQYWYFVTSFIYLLIYAYSILKITQQQEVFQQTRHYESILTQAKEPELNTLEPEASIIFEQIDQLIRQHGLFQQERLSLRDLATHSGLQEKTLSWAINQGSGNNFNDYINRLRIDAVCNQLQQQNPANILEIALAQGFSAKSTFNTAFKKHKGLTPTQFIKNLVQKSSES